MSAHYVYRVYDADSRLIYVGCSSNLFGRLKTHATTSWWAPQGVRVSAKVYADRDAAFRAESLAIRSDNPRWNVRGRFADNASWVESDYIDYCTALLNQPGHHSPARIKHLHGIGRSFRARFKKRIPLALPPHPDGPAEDRWLDPHSASEFRSMLIEQLAKDVA